MAVEIPTTEPVSFTAGDTVAWTKALADYPYDEDWRLTYYLLGPRRVTISTTADDDGKGFAVTYSAADSAQLEAGTYWLTGKVTDGTSTYTVVPTRAITVLPNLSAEADSQQGYDGRTFARKCLDALRAMFQGRCSRVEAAYVIFGQRSADLLPVDEALKLLSEFEGRVANEEKAEQASLGKRTGIYIRFRNPV